MQPLTTLLILAVLTFATVTLVWADPRMADPEDEVFAFLIDPKYSRWYRRQQRIRGTPW